MSTMQSWNIRSFIMAWNCCIKIKFIAKIALCLIPTLGIGFTTLYKTFASDDFHGAHIVIAAAFSYEQFVVFAPYCNSENKRGGNKTE